jgi:hypothetical protein
VNPGRAGLVRIGMRAALVSLGALFPLLAAFVWVRPWAPVGTRNPILRIDYGRRILPSAEAPPPAREAPAPRALVSRSPSLVAGLPVEGVVAELSSTVARHPDLGPKRRLRITNRGDQPVRFAPIDNFNLSAPGIWESVTSAEADVHIRLLEGTEPSSRTVALG